MSETTRTLDDLVAALEAGSGGALLDALGSAAVDVHVDRSWVTFHGDARRPAVATLLSSFEDLAVTHVLRTTTTTGATEQVVVSGVHVGRFAGVDPTGTRVRMNVSATAVPGADGTVARLRLTPDLGALTAEGGLARGHLGTATTLMAAFRENEAREAAGWHEPPVPEEGLSARVAVPLRRGRSRGRAALLALVLLGLGAGGASWWWFGSGPGGRVEAGALPVTVPSTAATSVAPTPTPAAASPSPSAVPSIATSTPTAPPKVQEGRQLVLTSDVLFSLGSAQLTPAARTALLGLAAEVRAAEVKGTVQVNGYTDDVGTPASNISLSRDRALAVARVLQPALAGIPITLQPQGFGEASPVATNSTPEGRAKNRRVTVVLPRS